MRLFLVALLFLASPAIGQKARIFIETSNRSKERPQIDSLRNYVNTYLTNHIYIGSLSCTERPAVFIHLNLQKTRVYQKIAYDDIHNSSLQNDSTKEDSLGLAIVVGDSVINYEKILRLVQFGVTDYLELKVHRVRNMMRTHARRDPSLNAEDPTVDFELRKPLTDELKKILNK
jgi:hypothetical protein